MTTIVIACAAALFAAALAVTVFVLGRRSRRATDAKLLRGRRRSSTRGWRRWCATSRLRSSAPRRRPGAPARSASSAARSISTRCSREPSVRPSALEGVDAAVISIPVEGGEPLVAAAGLGGAAPPATISGPPDGSSPRMIVVEYGYGRSDEAVEGGPIRAALAVPLLSDGEQLGYLTAYSRSGSAAFGESSAAELEDLALRAGPAIDNARRFREARQLADLDALTGLHNRRYFHETLQREVARAQRYSRRPRARRLRSRRLQGDQRPDRTPRGRRGARRGRPARPRRRAHRRRRLPRRRRRVRGDPARVVRHRRRPALQAAQPGHLGAPRRPGRAGCTSPQASRS